MTHQNTVYLLDANSLISAQGVYYPRSMVPELWDWIIHQSHNNRIKIPIEIYEEVIAGNEDPLTIWLREESIRKTLILEEDADPELLAHVTYQGYAPDLTDVELAYIGRDPFLIAYALRQPKERCVVSLETSKPSAQRKNRKVPDVCKQLGAECCNVFKMMRDLEFSTRWNQPSIPAAPAQAYK